MSQTHDDATEQLSAWMDGELPDAEARFLQRRLDHDEGLRAAWTRMQLASQCLRGQPWATMDADFAGRVAAGIEGVSASGGERPTAVRRPWRWAVAASVAALALLMAPAMLRQSPTPEGTIAEVPAPAVDHIVPSPATADLVALRQPAAVPAAGAAARTEPARGEVLVATATPSDRASPLPLSAPSLESPSEFPLVDTGEERSWPRSEVVGATSDPAIEAYLVRHNQMMASDGLGGFVPYVDVVANGRPAAAAPDANANADGADE